MLPLGHMGIGSKLVAPWAKGLPYRFLLLGTLLPDLVDKTLYYSLSLATGKYGEELGLISSTRTFGHTALFLVLLTILALGRRSKVLRVLALGMATHLGIDALDYFVPSRLDGDVSPTLVTLLWPLLKPHFRFSIAPFTSVQGHWKHSVSHVTVAGEVVGALILGIDFWKRKARLADHERFDAQHNALKQ